MPHTAPEITGLFLLLPQQPEGAFLLPEPQLQGAERQAGPLSVPQRKSDPDITGRGKITFIKCLVYQLF